MEYICATKKTAVAVLKALPTSKNLLQGTLSDPGALIIEVAICNTVCMHYMWPDLRNVNFHTQLKYLNTNLYYLKYCSYLGKKNRCLHAINSPRFYSC